MWYLAFGTKNLSNFSSSGYSFIVVKSFLFFLYNLLIVFLALETLFPIYSWYLTLAGLAAKKPYTRPTAEEVANNDRFFVTF